jgi:hypothetical protein
MSAQEKLARALPRFLLQPRALVERASDLANGSAGLFPSPAFANAAIAASRVVS